MRFLGSSRGKGSRAKGGGRTSFGFGAAYLSLGGDSCGFLGASRGK